MCGIVGYVGKQMALPILLEGLKTLEYRGYDSAGICLNENGKLIVEKCSGDLNNLENMLKNKTFFSSCGIGHTRWATHGGPEVKNAHPQTNENNTIAVVHNGIIENFEQLKKSLGDVPFRSSTDTEVFVHLLSHELGDNPTKQDVINAITKTAAKINGSYAFAIVINKFQDCLFLAKRFSPLLIGVGVNQNFVASDMSAFLKWTNKVVYLKDNQTACVSKNKIEIFDKQGKEIQACFVREKLSNKSVDLLNFDCYMAKEIEEDGDAILNTLNFFSAEKIKSKIPKRVIKKLGNIYICACGTAMHAGLFAKFLFEKRLKRDVICDFSSEFRYKSISSIKNSLCIFISQSGETADTIEGLRKAKSLGAFCVAITNVEKSRITNDADLVLYTQAGKEIAVASTKAYVAQVAALVFFLNCLLEKLGVKNCFLNELRLAAEAVKKQKCDKTLKKVVPLLAKKQSIFFVGRSVDYYLAMEGALKLKEISYIHCEAFAAGELKHGSLALIDKNSIVIVVLTQKKILEKTMNAVYEIKSRGGKIVLLSQFAFLKREVDFFIKINAKTNEDFVPLVAAKVLQQIALLTAKQKGLDPDKPRNLAKSVTVE